LVGDEVAMAVLDGPDEGAGVGIGASNQSSKLNKVVGDTKGIGLFGVAALNKSSKSKNVVGDNKGTGLLLDYYI
jgi:hypothetical protein